MYDSFKQIKKENKFKAYVGKNYGILMIVGAIALFSSGFIAEINFKYVFYISTIASAGGIIVILSLQEPKIKTTKNNTTIKHLRESIKDVLKSKTIILISIYGLIVMGVLNGLYKFHQLLGKEIGISTIQIGMIFATMYAVAGIASFNVKMFEKINSSLLIILMPLTLGISYILMGALHSPRGILFVFLEAIIAGISAPIIDDTLNKHVKSERRATVLSLQGFCKGITVAILSILIGLMAESKSLGGAYVTVGVFVIIIGTWSAFCVIKMLRNKNN